MYKVPLEMAPLEPGQQAALFLIRPSFWDCAHPCAGDSAPAPRKPKAGASVRKGKIAHTPPRPKRR